LQFAISKVVFLHLPLTTIGYWHLAATVTRDVSFAGAFAVVKRQGELKISEANAGAKLPECTACPVFTGSASQ